MTGSLHSLGRAARFVAISGEPGIGKTRLLEELGRRAEERDAVVLIGRGAELERDLPFGVWIDALDDHADWLGPERLQRMLGDRVGELARVLPSVTAATPAAPLALQDERYRAHRAVRALLERLAAANPVIVLLDDLQWADDSSLELVAHLLRRPPHARLVMAVAYRSGGLPSPVLAAFEAAGRDGMVVDVALSPLTSDEADVLLGEELSPRVREELYRLSGGNPFYLEQLAQPAAAPGDGAAAAAPAGTEVPAAVAAALGQELAALSEPARRLAQGAAVAGDPAGLELAAAAGELGDAELGAALDELVASRLIAPAAAPRRYRFRHPIVRRAAYESAGPGWRLGAHARAAAALEHMGGPLSARAHHLERCAAPGDEAAIAVLAQAGHAAAPSAPAEAARWYIAALGLLPAEDPGRRLELLVPLATALASTGRLEEALATLLDLLGLIPPELAELRARLVAGCAACENLLGRHGEAHARLERALAELPDQTGAAAAALEAELAADALYDSDFAALAERARRARASADALGDPGLLALTAALDCFAHYGAGRIPAALEAAAAAAATLDALTDDAARGTARRAVLPRLRGVPVRPLRRRDPPPAPRPRGVARHRPGPVRGADDGRAGACARRARGAGRGARHGVRRGRGGPLERQPAGARVGAGGRGLRGGDDRRRRARRARRTGGRRAAGRARAEHPHARRPRPGRQRVPRGRRGRALPRRGRRRGRARLPGRRAGARGVAAGRARARRARARPARARPPSRRRAPARGSPAWSCR